MIHDPPAYSTEPIDNVAATLRHNSSTGTPYVRILVRDGFWMERLVLDVTPDQAVGLMTDLLAVADGLAELDGAAIRGAS